MEGFDLFKKKIQDYLCNRAEDDSSFASRAKEAADKGKTLDGCCNYIIEQVKESGRIAFADDEIYGIAAHYYDEDAIPENITAPGEGQIVCGLSPEDKDYIRELAMKEYREQVEKELYEQETKRKYRARTKAEEEERHNKCSKQKQLSLFEDI